MAKIISVIGGFIAVILSVILACLWWTAFKYGLQSIVIAVLFFSGLIFFLSGAAEIKDLAKSKREDKREGAQAVN